MIDQSEITVDTYKLNFKENPLNIPLSLSSYTLMSFLTLREIYCQKKLENRTRIRVYRFHSWLKLQPCHLIGGDH